MHHWTTRIVIGLCVCFASTGHGQTLAGSVTGVFTNPLGSDVGGVGTNTITFPGTADDTGTLRFTATANYSISDQPFLLGRVDFQSVVTDVRGLTFQVTLGTQNDDGSVGSVDFCPTLSLLQTGEPGFREVNLLFDPNQMHTSAVNGTPYTFAFAGVTDGESWPGYANDTLYSVAGNAASTGYIWGVLEQAAPGTPIDPNCGTGDCGCNPPPGVPEPATGLLAILGLLGAAGVRRYSASRS